MVGSEVQKTKPPKGGRKGGTIFPRIPLAQVIEYSNNAVRKTHTGPQPAETLYVGVFGNKGPEGQVRASALKQHALLDGDTKGYKASKLAQDIQSATPEEKTDFLRKAFLSSKTFNHIYTTYQGDQVSPARLGQAAAAIKVHPDSVDECVDIFIQGAVTAGLATREGDDLKIIGSSDIGTSAAVQPKEIDDVTEDAEEEGLGIADTGGKPESLPKLPAAAAVIGGRPDGSEPPPPTPKQAGITVAFTVDSSLDAEKLQKHLELLRKYGVI